MVDTRSQNKKAHPAAPVMSKKAKVKIGIDPPPKRSKQPSKAARIRELEARLAVFEHPDDAAPISKDPLVRPLFLHSKLTF